MSVIRKRLVGLGLTERSIKIIISSWRKGTTSQYQTHLKKWIKFCQEKRCDVISPNLSHALDFLSMLHEQGLSYSSINTARSMLSSILQLDTTGSVPFGELPIVKKFMKGTFELRPSMPRYTSTWDLGLVLNWFRKGVPVASLSLKELTLKLTFLLLLLSGQRCQTVSLFSVDKMDLSDTSCIFAVTDKVKQTREGYHIAPVEYLAYPEDERLCVIKYLKEYVQRTKEIRNNCQQLLICHARPHGPASKDSIARWCKTVLSSAGVDTSKFKAHSTRSAATSFLANNKVNIKDIMTSVGWSSEATFQRFYHKSTVTKFNFSSSILALAGQKP